MHSIRFENRKNDWKNAMPLGNGVLGAMAYYDGNLHLPINHYEVYYNKSDSVLPEDILKNLPIEKNPGEGIKYHSARADRNQPGDGEPFLYYRLDKAKENRYFVGGFDGSYPQTGELDFEFSKEDEKTLLELNVENAIVNFKKGKTDTKIRILRKDLILTEVENAENLLKIHMVFEKQRSRDLPQITYKQIDETVFAYGVTMALSEEKNFSFAGVIKLIGALGELEDNKIILKNKSDSVKILMGIYTEWRYNNPLMDGIKEIEKDARNIDALKLEHKKYWTDFFNRSSICIPDKFLEKVYYINQYALDCSSGKDGVMKHHACGLNGLWDIKHPNLWGSMWYWDVNIQAAFAGVFSSNRLDLGKVFSDGLLSYVELSKRFAVDFHGLSGASLDYPYAMYHSTWPWCAQYLWAQYEYSLDTEYLKTEAYPLFLELCRFAVQLFKFDEKRGVYVVYPDISPEQGPLTHNSVITVASVKYMLKFTLQAAEILKDENELLKDIKNLYAHLPQYPTVCDDYGERLIDSEDAPKNLWIRHPSMLMPIFPIGEIDIDSDKRLKDIAINTVKFLEDNCEIGVFQVSWLSAAAARMGDGQRALRLLYEMGLDHLMRSNGLAAEVNERFMNYCLIMRQPLYYPCMMEFTGEMLAAVNEMLMQSNGGIIRIFPAMPTGDKEYERLIKKGYSISEYDDRYNQYPAWENVRFDKLLARGAVEVSASLKENKVEFIKIKSLKGGKVKITSPYSLKNIAQCKNNVIEFEAEAGKEYVFGNFYESEELCENEILEHLTYTKRRISIGENAESGYKTALDSFTRDWYLGNVRMENHNVYKFDFGTDTEKDYSVDLHRQTYGAEKMGIGTMAFNRLNELDFTEKRGFGFENSESIKRVDRGAPDILRRDFLEGTEKNSFLFDAPAGQYELFVVSGDECEDSVTVLNCEEGRHCGGEIIKAGDYQYKVIPLVHERDGNIKLDISTVPGKKWKLNYILVNLYKQL